MKQRISLRDEQPTNPPLAPVPPRPAPLPMPRRRRRYWLWGIIVCAVAGIGVLVWLHPWRRANPAGPGAPGAVVGPGRGPAFPQSVGTAAATLGDVPVILTGLGTVTPLATVTLKTQLSGYLVQVGFKEGQTVKQGDFIAQIDSRPYQALLAQFQGQLLRDEALLEDARTNLARYQTLFEQDSISKQTLDTQRATVHQYEGAVQMDKAQIESQKINLIYCRLVSPVDGRVGLRQVDPGNYVTPSDANGIVVITQLEPISVLFTLPEDNVPQVMKRIAAGAKLPVTALDRTNTREIATGVLETVDNQVDTTTGTIKLRAVFANRDGALFPSQFVNVRLLVDTVRSAVLVPNAAIQRGAPGTFVYLVDPNSTVSVRPVKTGQADDRHTSVLSDLKVGDLVVVDGADRLRDGDRVILPGAGGTPRGPSGGGQGVQPGAEGGAEKVGNAGDAADPPRARSGRSPQEAGGGAGMPDAAGGSPRQRWAGDRPGDGSGAAGSGTPGGPWRKPPGDDGDRPSERGGPPNGSTAAPPATR